MIKSNALDLSASELEIRGLSSRDVWDFENAFYWFSHPSRVNKLLAHYELYKSVVGLPGHVLELGVYKGASLVRFATFRNALENDSARKIVGFDAFGKFPTDKVDLDSDLAFVTDFEKAGGDGISIEDLRALLHRKSFQNIELVKGNVFDTLPVYLDSHPETRIALLHLDMDVREPTEFALSKLYQRVVPGGLVVFDDYNAVAGETEAVDEFVARNKLRLEKAPYYSVPSYVRKPLHA